MKRNFKMRDFRQGLDGKHLWLTLAAAAAVLLLAFGMASLGGKAASAPAGASSSISQAA